MSNNNKEIEDKSHFEKIFAGNTQEFLFNADEKNLKTKNNVCKKFIHKGCDNALCPFSHDISKTKICTNFMNTNHCPKGDLCDFIHRSGTSLGNKGLYTCKKFQDYGYCENGESCPYKHAKRVCRNYERGFCQFGLGCPDVHQEIKNPCPNYFLGFCPKGPSCKFAQFIH